MPEKRDRTLIPLSREHHFALLLCWKINEGIKLGVSADRISIYVKWFCDNYLLKHFKEEEDLLFPLLGLEKFNIKKALSDHATLIDILVMNQVDYASLGKFACLLNEHIRFEERVLFNEIQQNVTIEALELIESKFTNIPFVENLDDEFWITK